MKFIITSTSSEWLSDSPKPCEGAVLSEHKTAHGENIWEIEINSLEELIELKKKLNYPIILLNPNQIEGMYQLEIYDDYRE